MFLIHLEVSIRHGGSVSSGFRLNFGLNWLKFSKKLVKFGFGYLGLDFS